MEKERLRWGPESWKGRKEAKCPIGKHPDLMQKGEVSLPRRLPRQAKAVKQPLSHLPGLLRPPACFFLSQLPLLSYKWAHMGRLEIQETEVRLGEAVLGYTQESASIGGQA